MCMARSWTELLEGFGARDEIAFAVDFDDHADLSAGMNVVADQAFGGFARGLLGRGGLALLAQDVDGLFDVAIGLDKRGAAIAEAGVGPLSEFLHELCWNFHDWFLVLILFYSQF